MGLLDGKKGNVPTTPRKGSALERGTVAATLGERMNEGVDRRLPVVSLILSVPATTLRVGGPMAGAT